MNLFTAVSDFKILRKKYNNFEAPAAKVIVDGTEIAFHNKIGIANINVELSCLYPASGASFDIVNQYEEKQTNFSKKVQMLFQIGAKVEIEVGYQTTERVFYGLIAEVSYVFNGVDSPYIHVECCDAKFLLMKTRRLEVYSDTRLSQIVSDICSSAPISSYTTGKQIDPTDQADIKSHVETDYDFLVHQAMLIGYEFFIFDGKIYFRKPPISATPVMTITTQNGIGSATFSLRSATLMGKLSVVGIDPQNDKEVKSDVSLNGKFSMGSTAKRMLSGTQSTYFSSDVKSAADADKAAKILANRAADQFGLLECETVGLPQIVPGRHIKVGGIMNSANRTFYVTSVRHTFTDEGGFTTFFEGRIDSL